MGSGKAAYVERNYEMIHRSSFCIVYCHQSTVSSAGKSGTKIAIDYAMKQGRQIANVADK